MLQTFGFDISIDHPHTHVIRATQFIRGNKKTVIIVFEIWFLAPRELSQVAYFMATNSLYLTTFCLEMRSEIVAATCIYLAFAWSEFEVGLSSDGRVCSISSLSKIHFFSSEMVVVFGQRFDWRDAERKRSNIYQDIRGLSPSIDQMVDLSWPLAPPTRLSYASYEGTPDQTKGDETTMRLSKCKSTIWFKKSRSNEVWGRCCENRKRITKLILWKRGETIWKRNESKRSRYEPSARIKTNQNRTAKTRCQIRIHWW